MKLQGKMTGRFALIMLTVLCITLLFHGVQAHAAGTEGKFGGILRIALDAEPGGLDSMLTNATLVWTVSWHMFENLFTFGEKMEVIPMLAEDYTISEDGLRYVVNLRKGVPFHNGKEMTSEDVVASLRRWSEHSSLGKSTFENVASMKTDGQYAVEFVLKRPDAVFLVSLATPGAGAIIVPSEIASEAGERPMRELVGTGPFQFVEWQPNRFIKMKRFDKYSARTDDPNGFGGKKTAYVDELHYSFVADKTVQSVGVEAGDFDYAYAVDSEEYERLKETPGVQAVVSPPRAWLAFILNNKEGILSDVRIRRAMLAALDMEPILLISRGHPDVWRMDPSLHQKETIWWSEKGKDLYNQKNAEKAKALLKEAGYNKQPIRWMASYEGYYNAVLVAKSQLESAGFVINLNRFEPATETSRRRNPELWDASITGFTMRGDPLLNPFFNSSVAGWWVNEEVEQLKNKLAVESNFEKRYAMVERIQELFYEDVPYIKIGDYATLRLLHKRVQNFKNLSDIFFWNVWVEN